MKWNLEVSGRKINFSKCAEQRSIHWEDENDTSELAMCIAWGTA